MTILHLDALLAPRSVAVIGATDRPGSIGSRITSNLIAAGFAGELRLVHPHRARVHDRPTFASVAALPKAPDLAVVCTRAATVPGLVAALGERGTRAAIVIAAGLSDSPAPGEPSFESAMLESARQSGLRILGPNCLGLLVPGIGLNASFAHAQALPGNIAFISQSGAVCTVVIDWSLERGIGFSHFISTGNCADVDFGDLLDYLGSQPGTHAILLYLESLKNARKFMSAGRAAARNKPVIVLKSGRVAESSQAALSHTGMLAGADEVFDGAFRRAGMLRVGTVRELFAAVETLARAYPIGGERLAILTNGGGAGVMATDALIASGGRLAELAPATLERLDAHLPKGWSRANPVDIVGDAPAERYLRALEALELDPGVDVILLLQSPTAVVEAAELARALVPVLRRSGKRVLTCWQGGRHAAAARALFSGAGLACYDSPEEAVQALCHLTAHRDNRRMLLETPRPSAAPPDAEEAARAIISRRVGEGGGWLAGHDALAVAAAYGVAVLPSRFATTVPEAVRAARDIGYPVALKIESPQVTHKTEVGGVRLGLTADGEVEQAAAALRTLLAARRPDAELAGFLVQKMARPNAGVELLLGVTQDPVFGPVVLFGHGGVLAEHLCDRAIGLPPLDDVLARDLIGRTRVARLLDGFRGGPAADRTSIVEALISLARLATDFEEIQEIDINPLVAGEKGACALDARIRVAAAQRSARARMVILPYPEEEEERTHFEGAEVLLRPIRPADEPAHSALIRNLDAQDSYFRFFGIARPRSPSELARFTQIDYDREMAFVAILTAGAGRYESGAMLGVARLIEDPDRTRAEFSVVVRSELKGRGLGRLLMEKCIRYAKRRRLRRISGHVLNENHRMMHLARDLGFRILPSLNESCQFVELDLVPHPTART